MDVEYFAQIWKEREIGGHSYTEGNSSTWDRRVEEFNRDEPDERIETITSLLLDKKMLTPNSTVLDIGCGPGKFAMAFAHTAKSVTGVDISPKMLQSAAENVAAKSLGNVNFEELDWKTANLTALKWEKKFSLITTIMSPALDSKECLDKMLEASNEYCLVSHFVRRNDSVLDELKRDILHRQTIDEISNKSLYCSFNILWLYKKFPEIVYFDTKRETCRTLEEANSHYINRFEVKEELTPTQKAAVLDALKDKAINGIIKEKTSAKIACIYWKNG